ncbi:hypothetical protein Droror1_Dr00004401 [Drosera rotundifolia]
MVPEVSLIANITTPHTRVPTPYLAKSLQYVQQKCRIYPLMKRMKVNISKRLIHMLVLILAGTSILRLLRITISTYSTSSLLMLSPSSAGCNSDSTACRSSLKEQGSSRQRASSALTSKEFRFLADLITKKAPCNLLIFGLEPEYILLSEINAAGTTVILEDDPDKLKKVRRRLYSTRIHKVQYKNPAREAYNLLQHARRDQACTPNSRSPEASSCMLALSNLPSEIYRIKWDVVLVDGPKSDSPKAPGRMESIYSASLIAGTGNVTNVLVHDVDRTIEKWFAWEFLCEENLVSSKGRFWDFKIAGVDQSNSTQFCIHKTFTSKG